MFQWTVDIIYKLRVNNQINLNFYIIFNNMASLGYIIDKFPPSFCSALQNDEYYKL